MRKLLPLIFALVATRLWALNPVPYIEGVNFSARIIGTGSCIMTVYDESGSPTTGDTVLSGNLECPIATAWLRPGQAYSVNFQSSGLTQHYLSFTAPQGYELYLDGVSQDLLYVTTGSAQYSHDHQIELRVAKVAAARSDSGAFSGIDIGKSISWDVGLGGLRNGKSAGRICFKEYDLTNSPAARDRLYYTAPANYGQIAVVNDGPLVLRQVMTPQMVIDLVDVTGGYDLKFYDPSASTWNSGSGRWTFSGSEWKSISVRSPAANELVITETEGSVSRKSRLTLYAGAVSTGTYVWLLEEGSSTTVSRTTTHDSTQYADHRDDIVIVRTGGSSGTVMGKTKYRYERPGSGLTWQTNTISYDATTLPLTVAPGASVSFTSTVTNTGTNTFGSNHYVALRDSALNNLAFGSLNGLAPGAGTTASLGFTAPSTPGTYTYYLQGLENGVMWFTSTATLTLIVQNAVSGYDKMSYDTTDFPLTVKPGAVWTFLSNVTNTGTNNFGSNHYLVLRDASFNNLSFASLNGLNSGASTLTPASLTLTAPTTPGTYTYYLEGLQNGYAWFGVRATLTLIVQNGGWGEELLKIIADPDSGQLTTTYAYHIDPSYRGNFRKVKSVTEPTGKWQAWQYYDDWDRRGQLYHEFFPWLDSYTSVGLNTAQGRVVTSNYDYDWTGRMRLVISRLEAIDNVASGKTLMTPTISQTFNGQNYTISQGDQYSDASNYVRSTFEVIDGFPGNNPDFVGLPYSVKKADQSQSTFGHYFGGYNYSTKAFTSPGDSSHFRTIEIHGTTDTGADSYTSYDGLSLRQNYLVPNKSTKDVIIRNSAGLVVRTETQVYTGSGNFSLLVSEDFAYDVAGRLTDRVASNGATTTYSYTYGLLTSTIGTDGTETQLPLANYDELWRPKVGVKKGVSASGSFASQGDITTTNTYDAIGHITQTVVSGGSHSLTSSSTFDLAGRVTSSTAPSSSTNTYTTSYDYSIGPRTTKVTLQGGAYQTTVTYYDGQLNTVSGSAAMAKATTITRDATTGNITTQVNFGGSSTALVKTTNDWLGRQTTEVRPAWGSTTATRSWYYNSSGQLCKLSQPGLADTLYVYDNLGHFYRQGLDITANGTLDLSSNDRITESITAINPYDSGTTWWAETRNYVYSDPSSGTPVLTGVTFDRLNLPSNELADKWINDIYGNRTHTVTTVDRTNKKVTTTTTAPNSSVPAEQIQYNGLLMSAKDTAGIIMTYGYDDLGRLVKSIDPRTKGSGSGSPFGTVTAYVAGTNQVDTVTDPAGVVQATYTYDAAGRVSSVKDALNKFCYYTYTLRGEKQQEWGDTCYPVDYGYDNWGHQITMTTYRGGTGWSGSSWPTGTNPGTADVTTWIYDQPTGLLSSKTDNSSNSVSYTYNQAGQIKTRTWARGSVTTYYYFGEGSGEPVTGELRKVDYIDSSMTDLEYTYNRLGKTKTVLDAIGTRTFNYNLASTLEPQNEVLGTGGSDYYGDRRVSYGYDTTTGVVGRYKRLGVGNASNAYATYDVGIGYDGYGRINKVLDFNYTYTTDSHLIASITEDSSSWNQNRTYLPNRDLLDVIETRWGSTTSKAKFDYDYDNLGRATNVAKTGEIFNSYGTGNAGLKAYYGYDDRSQLTSEVTKLGTGSTVLTGRDNSGSGTNGYTYDNIGNRDTVTHNGNTATYSTNGLNQYTQRTVPGVFDVAGSTSSSTVTVNTSSSGITRHGDYFFEGHSVTNTTNAYYGVLDVADVTTTTHIPAFVAKTAESWVSSGYDADGNMLLDGRWDYTYDAENRIVEMHTHTALSPSILPNNAARKIEFQYDYLGRRVRKTVRDGWNGSSFATVLSDRKFLYDGWNLLIEFDASNSLAILRGYLWGLDSSGTLQGAGGVGGLLFTWDFEHSIYTHAIADGMGNIHGGSDYSTGAVQFAYEYDGFGNTLRESGPYAGAHSIRYSSKYTDLESGLVYYGLRYYSASLGRFLNKDPIEEKGGLNLYGFCGNDGVNSWDYLGMNPQFRGFAPMSPPVNPYLVQIGVSNSAAYQHNTYFVGPANAGISGYNSVLTHAVNPVVTSGSTRATVGAVNAYLGTKGQIASGTLMMAGTTGAVVVPGLGTVSGPVAIFIGAAGFAKSTKTQIEGFIDFGKGLSGQGYKPLPLAPTLTPLPYTPIPPSLLPLSTPSGTAPFGQSPSTTGTATQGGNTRSSNEDIVTLDRFVVTGSASPPMSYAGLSAFLNTFNALKDSLEDPTSMSQLAAWIEALKNPTQEKSLSQQIAEATGQGLAKDN